MSGTIQGGWEFVIAAYALPLTLMTSARVAATSA